MKIDVQGNSGCIIDIVNNDGNTYINKYTYDEKYAPRLVKQGKKQQKAYDTINVPHIKVPAVISIGEPDTKIGASINMEYIYSKNFVSFFELGDIDSIKHFADTICSFVDSEIINSNVADVDFNIILDKVDSVINNAKNNMFVTTNLNYIMLFEKIQNYLNEANVKFNGKLNIPVGICHGDLTLSNILFNGNDYYLIDFLDSFIDTPLQDICKLRQDTCYKWSTLMYTNKYDKRKVNIIYNYLDKYITEYFKKYKFYNEYYNILQMVNILRIMPYAKTAEVSDYLFNILNTMVD